MGQHFNHPTISTHVMKLGTTEIKLELRNSNWFQIPKIPESDQWTLQNLGDQFPLSNSEFSRLIS